MLTLPTATLSLQGLRWSWGADLSSSSGDQWGKLLGSPTKDAQDTPATHVSATMWPDAGELVFPPGMQSCSLSFFSSFLGATNPGLQYSEWGWTGGVTQ